MVLDIDSDGKVFPKSQVTDYTCRNEGLSGYNVFNFFVDTYEKPISQRELQKETREISLLASNGPGRPPHDRFRYLPNHPKHKVIQRIKRMIGHNNLPNIIGRYFPRRDDPDTYQFYCASMLLLLKPWRNIETDLKSPSQTWE